LNSSGTVSDKSSPAARTVKSTVNRFWEAGVNIIVLWNTISYAKGTVDARSTFLVYDLTGIDTGRRRG